MPFEIPAGLNPAINRLAWLVGRWEGTGKGVYPGTEEFDFLHYLSQTFEVDGEGKAVRPLSMETGFWRPQPDDSLEVVMCHPSGYAEVWYGKIIGAKIELATDAVVRTASADEYSAGQRLYGLVEGDLLWTFDKAAGGHPLQNHLWARLRRV
jgi:hypothetical protein